MQVKVLQVSRHDRPEQGYGSAIRSNGVAVQTSAAGSSRIGFDPDRNADESTDAMTFCR